MTTKQKIVTSVLLLTTLFVMIGFLLARLLTDTTTPTTEDYIPSEPPRDEVSAAAIEAVFDEFLANGGEDNWEPFQVEGQQVPVATGLAALGVVIPAPIMSALDTRNWGVYRCTESSAQNGLVLRLLFRIEGDQELLPYPQKVALLKTWESRMLVDVQAVLFPNALFPNQRLLMTEFMDITNERLPGLRTAVVKSDIATIGQLTYGVVGDVLYIGSDTACVERIAETVVGFD